MHWSRRKLQGPSEKQKVGALGPTRGTPGLCMAGNAHLSLSVPPRILSSGTGQANLHEGHETSWENQGTLMRLSSAKLCWWHWCHLRSATRTDTKDPPPPPTPCQGNSSRGKRSFLSATLSWKFSPMNTEPCLGCSGQGWLHRDCEIPS